MWATERGPTESQGRCDSISCLAWTGRGRPCGRGRSSSSARRWPAWPLAAKVSYCYDPSFAPAGKSVGVALFDSRLEPWKALSDQTMEARFHPCSEAYDARKDEVANAVADLLDSRVPDFKQAIEVVDVVTPVTYQRYTSNWRGSIEGWIPRPGTFRMDYSDALPHTAGTLVPAVLPGLGQFIMIGQWVSPGGGVPVAMDGRKVIQRICKVDGRGFQTSK